MMTFGSQSALAASAGSKAQTDTGDNVAHSVSDWLFDGKLYGYARALGFIKNFSGTVPDDQTYSVGGGVQYRSPKLYGLSFGLGVYTAQDFGLNGDHVEKDVPASDVTVLGKAFLRFRYKGLDVKAGRIGIDTPFANEDPFRRMIPLTYEGFGGEYRLPFAHDVSVIGYKIYNFKPFGSEDFVDGDTGYPRTEAATIPSVHSDGFYTAGIKYEKKYGPRAQAWYYHFDRRAQMVFGGVKYPFAALRVGGVTPFVGVQYLHESEVDDPAAGFENVDSDVYSFRIGFSTRNHTFYIADTYVPVHEGAFRNGAYYTPYQHESYNHSPLADGQPLKSMATTAQPGNVIAVRYIYHGGEGFKAVLGYTHLDLKAAPAVRPGHYRHGFPTAANEVDAGFMILSYDFTKRLNVSFEADYVDSQDRHTGNYHAERLYLTYRFGELMPDFAY